MTEDCRKCNYVLKIYPDEGSDDLLLYCHRFTPVPTPLGYLDIWPQLDGASVCEEFEAGTAEKELEIDELEGALILH